MTGARTLEVVHGLFGNLKVVMDGAIPYFVDHRRINETCLSRPQGINASTVTIQQALGMFNLRGTPNPPKHTC